MHIIHLINHFIKLWVCFFHKFLNKNHNIIIYFYYIIFSRIILNSLSDIQFKI